MDALVIAGLTLREAYRRWVLWVALLLGCAFLIVYAVGFNEIYIDIQRQSIRNPLVISEMTSFFLLAGLYVVNFLTIMMTVLTSVDTLSGEIASGTIQTMVTKPLRRWEIVVGKWLGFAVMLSLYLLFLAGGVILIVYLRSGYLIPHVMAGMGLMLLNIFIMLSVSLLGGSLLSTLANGAFVFGLYGIAFMGGWIEQFGGFFKNQVAVNIGILCSLFLPSEAIWRRAAYELQSPLMGIVGFSPFISASVPSPLMILYALLYTAVVLALAIRKVSQRDL